MLHDQPQRRRHPTRSSKRGLSQRDPRASSDGVFHIGKGLPLAGQSYGFRYFRRGYDRGDVVARLERDIRARSVGLCQALPHFGQHLIPDYAMSCGSIAIPS